MFKALAWLVALPFRFLSWVLFWAFWPFGKLISFVEWALGPVGRFARKQWDAHWMPISLILIVIYTAVLHDPSNALTFHHGEAVRWVLVGFANFFYGIWDSLWHFGADVVSIFTEKNTAVNPITNPGGYLLGLITYGVWAIVDSLKYWALTHLLTREVCWGIFFVAGVVALSSGKGGSHAPKPAAASHH